MLASLFLILLSAAATTMLQTTVAAGGHTVYIVNDLTYTTGDLLVHCRSGDDDLGKHYVNSGGGTYSFSFKSKDGTLFGCHVEPDSDYHADFVAFKECAGFGEEIYWHAQDYGVNYTVDVGAYLFVPWVKN